MSSLVFRRFYIWRLPKQIIASPNTNTNNKFNRKINLNDNCVFVSNNLIKLDNNLIINWYNTKFSFELKNEVKIHIDINKNEIVINNEKKEIKLNYEKMKLI
jgi:hypothetical protein